MAASDDEDQHQITLAGLQDQLLELRDIQLTHANRLEDTENTFRSEIDSMKRHIQCRSIYQAISSVDVHLRGSNNAQSTTPQGFAVKIHQDCEGTDNDDSHESRGKKTTGPEDQDPVDRGGLEDAVVDVDLYSSFLLSKLSREEMRELVVNLTSSWDTLEKSELVAQLCNNDTVDEPNTFEGEPEDNAPSQGNREESPKVNRLTSSAEKNRLYGEEDDFEAGSDEDMDFDEEAASDANNDSDGTNGESPPISPRSKRPSELPDQEEQFARRSEESNDEPKGSAEAQQDDGEDQGLDEVGSKKPRYGGNKYGTWEEKVTPTKRVNEVDNPDWVFGKEYKQMLAEGVISPPSEPLTAGPTTRSSSLAAPNSHKGSHSSVKQESKDQSKRPTTRHERKDSQVPQPSQRKRGGSASEAASRRHAPGSRNRNFTPTESRISEEAADEVIAPQGTTNSNTTKVQTDKASPGGSQSQPKSTKPTTQKPRNIPNNKETPEQPSPNHPHPKPSRGASIPPKQNDSSAQESPKEQAATMNPDRDSSRSTSDKTTSDNRKMPPPPTPAKPGDQNYRIRKRKRCEADEDEGKPHPVTLDPHTPKPKS